MISYVTAWDPQDALNRLFDQSNSEKSACHIYADMQVCDLVDASFMWMCVYATYNHTRRLRDINVDIWPGCIIFQLSKWTE